MNNKTKYNFIKNVMRSVLPEKCKCQQQQIIPINVKMQYT